MPLNTVKSYAFEHPLTINDLVEKHTPGEKLFLLLGNRAKLAFSPSALLSLNWNDVSTGQIENFCKDEQLKNNLVIGLLSYDLGMHTHKITPKNKTNFPLALLYSFENWVEEVNGRVIVRYRDEHFLDLIKKIADRPPMNSSPLRKKDGFRPAWDTKRYKTAFDKTKEYIEAGEIYQINLSYPLSTFSDSDAKDIFVQAQEKNKSERSGLFQTDDFDLISMSPETFISIEGRRIETFPIKGTQAKREGVSDKLIENKLINNTKEQAELNMISDLLRNDLSIVCQPDSVKIRSERKTTNLSRVIHTYSHIIGELSPGISSVQALLKIFPGGSISGCPKKRALEIIDEIEEYPRGPYTGSMFTLDAEDNLEANILIRTIVKKGNSISLPVGGGIVFDSEYRSEYQETLDKATSITEVFE